VKASGRHEHEYASGAGRRLREWWDGLSECRSGASAFCCSAALALLPLYTPPFLDTPGISFGGTMAQFAMVAIIAIGLNVWSARPACSTSATSASTPSAAYTVALLTSPDSPWNRLGPTGAFSAPWAWLSCVRSRMAFTALAGLILAFHARLRGDYLAIVTLGFGEINPPDGRQPGRHHQRPARLNEVAYPRLGESERLPEGVFSAGTPRATQLRHLVVLAGFGAHRRILLLVGNLERSRVGRAWWRSATTRTPRKLWVSTHSGSSYGRS